MKTIYKGRMIYRTGNSWFDHEDGNSRDCKFLFDHETFLKVSANNDDLHECHHPALKGTKCDCIGECGFLA